MNLEGLLSGISQEALLVLDPNIALEDYVNIDLSVNNKELTHLDISLHDVCEAYIDEYLKDHKARVAYGGYLEERNLYQNTNNFIGSQERNMHLGIDLWCSAGTEVLAVFEGEIHSFQNNKQSGDYGPTLIIKHSIEDQVFYSLYGHLSRQSLKGLKVGAEVHRGETIARLGTPDENVGYAPHLHFQLIRDLECKSGDYPGVCAKKDLDFYRANCPDPNLLLKL